MMIIRAPSWRAGMTGLAVVALAMLTACSHRYATNDPIRPRFAAPETATVAPAALDPDHRLFLDPVSLSAVAGD